MRKKITFNFITMRPLFNLLGATMLLIAASCNKNNDSSLCPDCPVITAISPGSGAPGDIITITGEKFDGLEFVIFDNNQQVAIDPQMTTSTQTKVAVPNLGKNGSVKVQVARRFTSGGGGNTTLRSEEDILFTYVQGPLITGFSPVSGKKGDVITITGKFFGNNPVVLFPSAPATTIVAMSDTLIQVMVPAKAGSGFIQVKNGGLTGQSSGTYTHQIQIASTILTGMPNTPGDVLANGNLSAARFYAPYKIVSAGSGILYVWDAGNKKIKKINTVSNEVTTVATLPSYYEYGLSGYGSIAYCDECGNIRIDADGILYISAKGSFDNRAVVLKINPLTGLISTALEFTSATGVIYDFDIDESKNLYLLYLDADPNVVGLYKHNSAQLNRINPLNGLLSDPDLQALSIEYSLNNIYLGIKPSILKFSVSGVLEQTLQSNVSNVKSLAVTEENEYFSAQLSQAYILNLYRFSGGVSQILSQIPYEYPSGICTDNSGNLYIADLWQNVILKVTFE